MVYRIILIAIFLLTAACVQEEGQPIEAVTIDDLALRYLQLELSMGEHDPGHVDAYFGPEELRNTAIEAGLSLDDITTASDELAVELRVLETSDDVALEARVKGLLARLLALNTRIAMKQGESISFDDEVRRLFATSLPLPALSTWKAAAV